MTPSASRQRTAAFCADRTAGADVKRTSLIPAACLSLRASRSNSLIGGLRGLGGNFPDAAGDLFQLIGLGEISRPSGNLSYRRFLVMA